VAVRDRFDHSPTVTTDVNTSPLDVTNTTEQDTLPLADDRALVQRPGGAVDGKKWTEYEQPDDLALPPGQNRRTSRTRATTTSGNFWSESSTTDYKLGMNLGHDPQDRVRLHNSFQNVQYVDILDLRGCSKPDGLGRDARPVATSNPTSAASTRRTGSSSRRTFVARGGRARRLLVPGQQLEDAVADTSEPRTSRTRPHRF
jgi:hypothetical protein